jgi:type I restriction enzyme S subunit
MALFCSPRIHPKYLVYYLTSLSDAIERQGVGATVKGITLRQVGNWPLPPLSEQRRIAEILDQADALRKKQAEADAKGMRIMRVLFIKIFGKPHEWTSGDNIRPLARLVEIYGGGTPSKQKIEAHV